ncbi:MAG TPA: hypothetical protein VGH44_04395 [Candidatus Saccharimonadia bacterium]|jgi:hypothetical protein
MTAAMDTNIRQERRERIEALRRGLDAKTGRKSLGERVALMQEFLTALSMMPYDSISDEFDIDILREWIWAMAATGGFFTRSGVAELARYLKVLEPHFVGAPTSYFRPGFVRLVMEELGAAEALLAETRQPMPA